MANPQNFIELQAGFYNALIEGLGYSSSEPFQIIQSSPPLTGTNAQAEASLYNHLNTIPSASLTQNTAVSTGNRFSLNYQNVISALQAAPNNFESTVGIKCAQAYYAALQNNTVASGAANFRQWALNNDAYASAATSGASALAAAMLDPIFAAQINARPYNANGGTLSATFATNYDRMRSSLRTAPSISFTINAGGWNTNVSNSWANGVNKGLSGLLAGSSPTATLNQKFAQSSVTVHARFRNVLSLQAAPGEWYAPSALGLAYNNQNRAPWNSDSAVNWENTFGQQGTMQRFTSSLVIANEMEILLISEGDYSDNDQQMIRNNSAAGLWPFYSTNSGYGSDTRVSFDANGNMVAKITSNVDVPVVIGRTVASAADYLGAEAQASKILTNKYYS